MWGIDSKPNPDEANENEVNFRRKCGNSGYGPHLRGKIDDFCVESARRDFGGIINETQPRSRRPN
jgi:hypothetical protein